MSNKDLTIQLMVKALRVPVTEKLPVIVIWSRQSKQAKTKKRLLSDQVDTTVFDETFNISTSMVCDEEGNATKPKMVSQLIIFSLPNCLSAISLNSQSQVTKAEEFQASATSTWLSSATMTSRLRKSRFESVSTRARGSKQDSKLSQRAAQPVIITSSMRAIDQLRMLPNLIMISR